MRWIVADLIPTRRAQVLLVAFVEGRQDDSLGRTLVTSRSRAGTVLARAASANA